MQVYRISEPPRIEIVDPLCLSSEAEEVLQSVVEEIEAAPYLYNGPTLMSLTVTPELVTAYHASFAHYLGWKKLHAAGQNPFGPGPIGAGIFISDGHGNILWTKRSSTVLYPGYWCFSAAGGVDSAEGFRAAILSELSEELGIGEEALASLDPLHLYDTPESLGCYMTFVGRLHEDAVPKPNPAEIVECRWAPSPYHVGKRQPFVDMLWEHTRHAASF